MSEENRTAFISETTRQFNCFFNISSDTSDKHLELIVLPQVTTYLTATFS